MRLAMIQMSNSGSVEKNMEKVCMRLQCVIVLEWKGRWILPGSLWLSMQMERFLPGQMTQSRLCMWILTWRNPGKCGRKDLMLSLGEKSFMYNVAESCQNMIVCIKK